MNIRLIREVLERMACSDIKSITRIIAHLAGMCDTLMGLFTTIYPVPCVLNKDAWKKDGEGCVEEYRSLFSANKCLLFMTRRGVGSCGGSATIELCIAFP